MELSIDYKKNIETMFGKIGKDWLMTVPEKIEKYVNMFDLKNVKLLNDLTYNVLLFADSNEFGNVVLKIEIPFKELTIRESEALKLNNGIGACKCYYSNIEDGVLLIERLLPGRSLGEIKDLKDRIKIFSDVSSKFNIEVEPNDNLPTYMDILNRSIFLSEQNKEKFECVVELLQSAMNLYEKLHSENKSNYLLHSDLYCGNILESNEGWKAIDPHGFIGERILDTAIFIQKEIEKQGFDNKVLEELITAISEEMNLNKKELLEALFINYVLNICWDIEVNLDSEHILSNIEKTKKILEKIESKGLQKIKKDRYY